MKKRIISMIMLTMISVTSLSGCGAYVDDMNQTIEELETQIKKLEKKKKKLKSEITDIKIENGTAKYVVTFNIKQTHFTLDLGQHLKDGMNDVSIQIPVDKEYYDAVSVGDVIDDSFRLGSFIFKGSIGNWKITIEDKEIQ